MLLPALVCALAAGVAGAAPVHVQAVGSDGKPLAEAVVFLESREARAAARPLVNVEVAQADRRFVKRVTVVTVGTEVRFANLDKVRHHVYSFSPAKNFELKLFTGVAANPVVFDKAGIAVLGCNIHDNMVAWVVVVETPHHAVADARGSVHLHNVPPGSYRLRTWHPGLPLGTEPAPVALTIGAADAEHAARLSVRNEP